MVPPGQQSSASSTSGGGASSNTVTVALTPNVLYGGATNVKPRNATLILDRDTPPQEQYAVIADGESGSSGLLEGKVVYNGGSGDGSGSGGPTYAIPNHVAGASGANVQYDGWTVNETYASSDGVAVSSPTYAVYAGSANDDRSSSNGAAYATVKSMRARSNSLFSLSSTAQRDRSGTLQLAAAQQGVVYNIPMEEGDANNSSNI